MQRLLHRALAGAAVAGSVGLTACLPQPRPRPPVLVPAKPGAKPGHPTGHPGTLHFTRLASPDRTEVTDDLGAWWATLTDHSYTVTLAGPARTFTEPGTSIQVTTHVEVRTLPAPFSGVVDTAWLDAALADTSPDVLAEAMQYERGAPDIFEGGVLVAGEAHYGRGCPGATCQKFDDHNDYSGVPWSYAATAKMPAFVRAADPPEYQRMDCSGYIRMIFGRRQHLPLTFEPGDGQAIPRRSYEIADTAPGVVTIPNTGVKPALDGLAPGDLVFFDVAGTGQIDHIGMYLGPDTTGRPRFVSSRQTFNGPSFGNVGGASTLDHSTYGDAFRMARRL